MAWCYSIDARRGQRLLMRVMQIFDQQALTPHELTWRSDHRDHVEIVLSVDCPEPLARRLHAKLHHLHDVTDVRLAERSEAGDLAGQCGSNCVGIRPPAGHEPAA